MRSKVSIIGTGAVGSSVARQMAERGTADVVMVDILPGIPQGKALDLGHGTPLWGSAAGIEGTNDYQACAGSELIIVTAGCARKPGMTRADLLAINAKVIFKVVSEVAVYAPHAIILVVTNPVDVMTYLALQTSGLVRNRVLGMGGTLDSARWASFIAGEMGISPQGVQAMVLGEHGDSMVILPRYASVAGLPVTELIPADKLANLMERTRRAGAEVVGHLKSGSAYYAPAAAACEMAAAILRDEKRILPASVCLEGEYGLTGVCLGVPIKLGRGGVEEILELELTSDEQALIQKSAEKVRRNIEQLNPNNSGS